MRSTLIWEISILVFVCPGTEGECRTGLGQYKDTPMTWKVLTEGTHEQYMTTVGREKKVQVTKRQIGVAG